MAELTASPRLWVFDIDDTLYLERDYVRSGFVAVGAYVESKWGVEDFGSRCWKLFCKGARRDVFNQACSESDLPTTPTLITDLVSVYREHHPAIALNEATRSVLDHLHNRYELAIVTGGSITAQQNKVRALELSNYTDSIVYAGQHGPQLDKPHPWSWQQVEASTGYSGSDLIYIGDNPSKDFPSPVALGWQTLRVRLAHSEHFGVPTPAGVEEITTLVEVVDMASERP